jgi:hypothetical protein
MDWIHDLRSDCWSVMTSMVVGDYLALVSDAHSAQGALSGQRGVLATTTAKRIRTRMVEDLRKGASLPPLVIGAVLEEVEFRKLPAEDAKDPHDFLPIDPQSLSVIDGMQRTAALNEAVRENPDIATRRLRVEFWLTDNVRAMIYRMLILNTGQVPWTISRQLSVVFAPLLEEIERNVPEIEKMSTPDKPGRRVGAAQYSSDNLVELYIAFSLRKTSVDSKEAISDEFSRLDFVENLSDAGFQDQFYGALSMMSLLDKSFGRYDGADSRQSGRFIFDRQPARIGFIVALGTAILGRPGADRASADRAAKLAELQHAEAILVTRLKGLTQPELGEFLKLDVLDEVLNKRVGQVGRYERSVFSEAFKVLIEENFVLENLEPCWRAS